MLRIYLKKTIKVQFQNLSFALRKLCNVLTDLTFQELAQEFANCPAYNGGFGNLNGRVTISPICPVESVPPQPQCAPKGYSTGIFVSSMNFSKQIYSDSNGCFSISFPIGNYSLKPIVANVLPRCDDVDNVQIKNNSTTTANINCDSGIR